MCVLSCVTRHRLPRSVTVVSLLLLVSWWTVAGVYVGVVFRCCYRWLNLWTVAGVRFVCLLHGSLPGEGKRA